MQAMRSIFNSLEKKLSNTLSFTIATKDVINSIVKTKPSTSDTDNNKFKVWQSQYASYWVY